MEEPKHWTTPAPPTGLKTSGRPPWQTALMAVAGLIAVGLGVMQMGEGLGALGLGGASNRFDPANPPTLGDPSPAILAHIRQGAGSETLEPALAQEIEQFATATRAELPRQMDEMTTMVGVLTSGRRIAFDYRVMLNRPVADVRAFRKQLVEGMRPVLTAKMCEPGNAAVRDFLSQRRMMLSHAYTLNDGGGPFFIDLAPDVCTAPQR
jgi:hypothetical protein